MKRLICIVLLVLCTGGAKAVMGHTPGETWDRFCAKQYQLGRHEIRGERVRVLGILVPGFTVVRGDGFSCACRDSGVCHCCDWDREKVCAELKKLNKGNNRITGYGCPAYDR